MNIRAVFSDVDGTFLTSRQTVLPGTIEAVKKLEERNIPFTIATGRAPFGVYPILDDAGIRCHVISCSGAVIMSPDRKVIYEDPIDRGTAIELESFLRHSSYNGAWGIYTPSDWVTQTPEHPAIVHETILARATCRQGDISSIASAEGISKILCIASPEETDRLQDAVSSRFPQLYAVKSAPTYLEIMNAGVNKASAIKILCDLLHVDIADTIAFGDNFNDIEMLQTVGTGVVMGNAPAEVRAIGDMVTDANNHDGIYNALVKLGIM